MYTDGSNYQESHSLVKGSNVRLLKSKLVTTLKLKPLLSLLPMPVENSGQLHVFIPNLVQKVVQLLENEK